MRFGGDWTPFAHHLRIWRLIPRVMQQFNIFNYRLRDCRPEPSNSHQHNCYIFRSFLVFGDASPVPANLRLLLGTRTTPKPKRRIWDCPCPTPLLGGSSQDGRKWVVRTPPIYLERVFASGVDNPILNGPCFFHGLSTTSIHWGPPFLLQPKSLIHNVHLQGIRKTRQY